MSQPGMVQRMLASAIKATLVSAGNPFHAHEGNGFKRPLVLSDVQRRQLVAGLGALDARLAGEDCEQLVADELATLCHKLTTRETQQ
jgi:hypothetical protein